VEVWLNSDMESDDLAVLIQQVLVKHLPDSRAAVYPVEAQERPLAEDVLP
jgi:hypothetical protein